MALSNIINDKNKKVTQPTSNTEVTSLMDISTEKYNIQEQWLENIAPKYLDLENITNLKVGLFGYLNEVMSTTVRNSIAHRNFLYDEAFLNTATLMRSLYNKAKTYNYDIKLAKPAVAEITFSIKQSSIIKYGKKTLGTYGYDYEFTLSEDDKYFMGKYQFLQECDIKIKATRLKDNTYNYIARFDRSKYENNTGILSGDTYPYIDILVDRGYYLSENDVITIHFPIYQVEKTYQLFNIYSNEITETMYFNKPYTNNLCNFYVIYKLNNEEHLLNSYFNDTFTPDDEYYHYYSLLDDSLNIYFSGLQGTFRPQIGSSILVYTYTTLGTEGNFNYTGSISHKFADTRLQGNVECGITLLKEPSGATNSPTKSELKEDLIYEFLTRNCIITEFDLNNFFNKIINQQVVNNSEILFIRKRDDVMKRLFVGYLLLRDKSGLIIPSNTIDLNCNAISINEDFLIPSGSLISHKKSKVYAKYDSDLIKDNYDKKYKFDEYLDDFVEYIPEYDEFKDKLTLISRDSYELLDSYKYFRDTAVSDHENSFILYNDEVKNKFEEYKIEVSQESIIKFMGNDNEYIPYEFKEKYDKIYQARYNEFYSHPENEDKEFPEEKLLFNIIMKDLYVIYDDETDKLLNENHYSHNNKVYDNFSYNPPISCIEYKSEWKNIKSKLKFISSDKNCILKNTEYYIQIPEDYKLEIDPEKITIYEFNGIKFIKYSDSLDILKLVNYNIYEKVNNPINRYIEYTDNIKELIHSNELDSVYTTEIYTTEDGKKYIQLTDERYAKLKVLFVNGNEFVPDDPDTLIIPNEDIKFSIIVNDDDNTEITDENLVNNEFVYRIPYAVYYKKDPYQRLLTVKNDLDESLYFKFLKVNANINSEFIFQKMNIKRSPITYNRELKPTEYEYNKDTGTISKKIEYITDGNKDTTIITTYDENEIEINKETKVETTNDINKYFLSFNLSTTLLANLKDSLEKSRNLKFSSNQSFYNYFRKNKYLIVRCLIKNEAGSYIGYFDFDCDDYSKLVFHKELTTDNYINGNNELRLVDCVYGLNDEGNTSSKEFNHEFYLPEKFYFEVCFLVKNEETQSTVILDYPLDKHHDLTTLNISDDSQKLYYTESVRFISNKPFSLFLIMNDIISPILEFNQSKFLSQSERGIKIKCLPVIGKHYLYNYSVFKDFFYMLYVYYTIFKSNFDKLENNTSVNINFYNTYGYSKYFKLSSREIISTNISLDLTITLVESYTLDLDFKIKNFILDFIEKVNKTSNKVFALSNLSKALEDEFPDIHYIEFEKINGHDLNGLMNQTIIADYPAVETMTKEQLINYIPEYINIDIGKEAYTDGQNNFNVAINITYK